MRFRKFNHYIYNILPILSISLLVWLAVSFIAPDNYNYSAEVVYAADANNPNKTTPTASLTVSNSGTKEINVQPNSGTIYSNHVVTIDSINITNYTLTISGPATLSSVSGKTTITEANGASGNSLPDSTWGYNYNTSGITSESSFASSNYTSFSGSNQTLESANGSPSSIERSLVLAAKFGDTAEPGHYAGQVNLSLTAVPKVLTTYTITYNANSGSGTPSTWSDSSYDDSYTTTISSTTPTRSGYTFLGWNTSSTATSANSNYAAGKSITLQSSSPTLNLYAIWRKTVTLTFNANNGSGGPGTQTCYMYNSDANCTITISSTKPTRTGYDFQGWGTTSTTSTVSYSSGGSITLSTNKTIYAVWKMSIPTVAGFGGVTTMQDFKCSDVNDKTSGQLYDIRDNSTYTIAKLSDGKCWMTQNLRITRESIKAKDSTNTTGRLTTATSNVGTGTLEETGNGYEIPASTTAAFDITKGDGAHYTNQQVRASVDDDYGAYYSYNVATVNTIVSSDSGDAQYDICPAGWRLPTSGSSGEFRALYIKYPNATPSAFQTYGGKNGFWLGGATGTTNSPASNGGAFFPAAGSVDSYGFKSDGLSGYYWSSTVCSATFAYYLSFTATSIAPSNMYSRYLGHSVRCVAK